MTRLEGAGKVSTCYITSALPGNDIRIGFCSIMPDIKTVWPQGDYYSNSSVHILATNFYTPCIFTHLCIFACNKILRFYVRYCVIHVWAISTI